MHTYTQAGEYADSAHFHDQDRFHNGENMRKN